MVSIESAITRLLPEIIAFRRDLHQYPELGYQEVETAGKVIARLRKQGGFKIETGIASTGIVATLAPEKTGRGIALRADMDCLPILETSGQPWASQKPGYMHACGHDGHTSCLLGTALCLSEYVDCLKGPVKFIFQPAEEGGAGGDRMAQAGVLENPDVHMIFGLHGWPGLSLGEVATCSGPMMANADEFAMTVQGHGGHAAFPHKCVDPVLVASHIITALQSITSRMLPPEDAAVVTVAKIEGGSAFNIIPDEVKLLGTIRTMSETTQSTVFERMTSIATGIAASMNAKADVSLTEGYPVLTNHPDAYAYLHSTFVSMTHPVRQVEGLFPQMVGEDFAYFAKRIPACFFALGLKPEQTTRYPQLHQSEFDFNDNALPIGMRCFSELVLNFWNENPPETLLRKTRKKL